MDHASPTVVPVPPDVDTRVRAIRSRLPGQMLRERLETAALVYGPLYSLGEVRQRVADSLQRRVGFVRGAAFESIESYQPTIPDAALLKYDDAARSGLFARFMVATPTYYREHQMDPWIVAEVAGSADRWAVIAQWDV